MGAIVAGGLAVVLLGAATTALAVASRPRAVPLPMVVALPTPAPTAAPSPRPAARTAGEPLAGWANRLAAPTGIPAVALLAYARAQLSTERSAPGCHLSWPTLAGIGYVESDHGRYGGAGLLADGHSSRRIIGVPLDGSPGVRANPDTDGGRLDGDPRWDHAVGPLQFLPATWRRWGSDGDGDAVADPYDLDDAALAAARYLCAAGGDLRTGSGWSAAIGTYNAGADYRQRVYDGAEAYARRSLGVRS